jgi:tRNA-2-methylthio-N6-dimethylallyladenosine synthase
MKKEEFIFPSLKEAKKRNKDKVIIERNLYNITDKEKDMGVGKKFYLRTYGCQANVRDSETISGIMFDLGYQHTENEKEADVIIFNTCAIRKNAEDKVIGEIGNLKRLKRTNPDLMFILCGCMAQEEDVVEKVLRVHHHIDIIFGTHNIYKLPQFLSEAAQSKERVVEVLSEMGEVIEDLPVDRFGKHKAWVNIMYGCDKFCTYCIVPYTRGKERSRLIEDVVNEVNELKADGFKEITLLGQNVNAYGKDLNLGYDFSSLMEEVAKTGIERVRFTTSHPWDFTFEMVDVIAKFPNIMPYIHLPVQSGNTSVLKLMGRRYSREKYLALFDYIKEKIPHCSITTDIIVGFPNETREQFEETLSLVNYCKYDGAYTFVYSPRVGTPAADMDDNISKTEKDARLQELNELVNSFANESNQKYQNKVLKVLVDGLSKKSNETYSGYSEENKLVNFKADNVQVGDIVNVKITEVHSWSLNGELIK